MPRIALILSLILAAPAFAAEKPAACGARVRAYNVYEELNKEKQIVEKVSFFEPSDWSPDAGFDGLVVKAGEDPKTKIEIEVRPAKGKAKKAEWPAVTFEQNKDYLAIDGFNEGKEVFGEHYKVKGTYVIRLKLDGKVLCEDKARRVAAGH